MATPEYYPTTSASLNMSPRATYEQIENPQSNVDVYEGSMISIFRQNLGYYVVCEFVVGQGNIVRKEGILYSAGLNFFTLYQQELDRYVVCDIFSVKFVYFYESRTRPRSLRRNPQSQYY